MPSRVRTSVIGFVLAAGFSSVEKWSLPEFCWSAWLAGLVFAWACVVTAGVHILLTARSGASRLGKSIPRLADAPLPALLSIVVLGTVLAGGVALKLYSILFGFYGLFLSVFAEMEPHSLFGRNGFINSDFFTPVTYLLMNFWPMAVSTLIVSADDLVRGDPWKRLVLPMESEVLRMHLMVLALPFLSLVAWALFGAAYERVTVVLLIGVFFLVPKPAKRKQVRT